MWTAGGGGWPSRLTEPPAIRRTEIANSVSRPDFTRGIKLDRSFIRISIHQYKSMDWRLRDARDFREADIRGKQERKLRKRRSKHITRRILGRLKSACSGGGKERRNCQPMKCQIPQRWPDGAVAQNLAGRAVTLLATDRSGMLEIG